MAIPQDHHHDDDDGWTTVIIGIGSNIDPERWIPESLRALSRRFREVRVGPFFLTRPLGGRSEQPPYVNGVAAGRTDLPARAVVAALRGIEDALGRVRNPQDRYAPRTIDLDLLAYGGLVDPDLGLPDPELLDRDFYFLAASILLPDFVHPERGVPLGILRGRHVPRERAVVREFSLAIPGDVAIVRGDSERAPETAGGCGCPDPVLMLAAAPWTAAGLRLAALALAAYAGVCLFMYVRQPALVFLPGRNVETTPEDAGMPFEDLYLAVPDQAGPDRINAWFVPAPEPSRGAVLFCHGNAGDLGDRIDTIRILRDLGFDVLAFDYRGYGRSTGKPSESALYEDARACWRYLTVTRGVPPARVCVHGRSLGGAVAARLAADCGPPGAVVLESTFTTLPDVGQRIYPWLPVRLLARYRFPTIDFVRRLRCPVVVVHSPEDELVPYDMGRALFEAAPGPKAFIEIHGDHANGFLDSEREYAAGLAEALIPWFPLPGEPDGGRQGRGSAGTGGAGP